MGGVSAHPESRSAAICALEIRQLRLALAAAEQDCLARFDAMAAIGLPSAFPEEAPMAAVYRRLALATLVLWACADDEHPSSTVTAQAVTTTVTINGGAT